MDESHFEDTGARIMKYVFFSFFLLVTGIGIWQKEAILGYFSFREFGEARIVINAIPGTSVSVMDEKRNKREIGLVGRDGKFTLVEQGSISKVRIHLFHPYYFPEEKEFENIEKGEVVTFQATMAPLLGSLSVRTIPDGATVYVNDKKVGVSPWKKRDIRDGTKMLVEVRLTGFITQRREVEIQGGKEEELVLSLDSTICSIILETDKAGFDFASLLVFIEGNSFPLEGNTIQFIPPGRHPLQVMSHDGLKLEKEINIKPGQTLHLKLPDWFVEDGG
jgi:hypothetical protein